MVIIMKVPAVDRMNSVPLYQQENHIDPEGCSK